MRQVEFVKYNRTRAERFQLKTAIVRTDGTRCVEKTALTEEGVWHIRSFAEKYDRIRELNPGVCFLEPVFSEDKRTVRFPYLTGQTLGDALGETIRLGRTPYEALEQVMAFLFPEDFKAADGRQTENRPAAFYETPVFREAFGKLTEGAMIPGRAAAVSNVDGLFENLMLSEGRVYGIDYEWVFAFPIPAGFLHYRNLLYFYRRYENVLKEGQEALFAHFGIEGELLGLFAGMEEAFQSYVHGAGSFGYMKQYEQPVKTLEFLLDRESELYKVKDWCEALKAEIAEKDVTIQKQQEVQRLTNNHVANLDIIIGDLRRENAEIAKTLQYLAKHEALIWKVLRKCHRLVERLMPKGTKKRKVLQYLKNTLLYPKKYGRLYFSADGRNRIRGDFKIGAGYLEHGKLYFPKEEAPVVSIVIPVYNQVHYTYACLLSILENTPDVSYEILIADDVSTDATKELNRYVENVTVCRNATNQGFLRNCNQAAKAARGKYIMFLNNDTQVTPGWLSSLVNLLESDPSIGMAGSKLVYPDGRLQEAGGIIWSDGSGWNYGRLDDPDKAEYNYVKDVDYISGAAILLSVSLWKQIGGFDDRFAPAYCEDSDLAFAVRQAGYRVVYQPLSKVIHFEGVSNGTDVNGTGLKRYQVENSKKLKEKWAKELKKQCVNTGNPNPFRARERSQEKPVILFVDHYVPTFDKDAGSKTTFQYLKMFLKKGYSVKFLGDNFLHEEPYSTTLQQMGVEILYGPEYQAGIWDWILKNKDEIDFAYLNRPHIASKYVDFLQQNTKIKLIYYGHDLHFLREYREYELTGDIQKKRDSDYWRSVEFALMEKVAVSYYPSEVEKAAIHAVNPGLRLKAITAYVFEEFLKTIPTDFARREGLLFVGGFAHPPNADAVLWFAREIFPLIRKRLDVPFYVVGSKVTEEIKALEQPGNGIIVKGFVSEEELSTLYASCRVVVVPLRYGAGVKGKVVEAVYNGAPVVTTAIGAEGIPGAEAVMRIADTPEAFAESVIGLYEDPGACKAFCEATQRYIRDYFSVDAAWSVIEEDFTVVRPPEDPGKR
ncbi:MAG: glycosyltransferase [Lachnospiraceae bacterium]|nr:glycosyltransferase [Lachnospiraceae bacterium]